METRPLGTTDLKVSIVCLGTMTWGEQNSEQDAHNQLDRSLDAGINFVDTAEMYAVPPREKTYGLTERYIGSWLEKSGRRDEIVLATKVAGPSARFPYIRPHLSDGKSSPGFTRQSVIEACEASLKRLKTDVIDLYQLHWPSRVTNFFGVLRYKHLDSAQEVALEETLEALGELQKAGKIRHIGLSNETPWGLMHALKLAETKGLPRVQSVQNPYSLLNRSYEIGMAEISIREQCGLLAYSPLGFGVLSGKYQNGAKPAGARLTLFGDTMTRYMSEASQKATDRYVELARDHGLDAAEMALAFVHAQRFTTSTIIGATTLDQLEAAVRSADVKITKEIYKAIDAIEDEFPIPAP